MVVKYYLQDSVCKRPHPLLAHSLLGWALTVALAPTPSELEPEPYNFRQDSSLGAR